MGKKVLFINQEITPYVPESEMSVMGNLMPHKIQELGFEIRTFMPKWGIINERRGQLHEVIRLSGMNLIIDDTDHPLIIKVASIPQSRIQVYFIDNEDYFQKRKTTVDDNGDEYSDNGERAIFLGMDECRSASLCKDRIQGRTAVCQHKSGHFALFRTAQREP